MDAFLVLFVIISLLALGGLGYFSNSRGKVNRLFASMALWAAIWAALFNYVLIIRIPY